MSHLQYTIALSADRFFALIKDGEWHTIEELSDRLEIPASKLTEFSTFLSKRGLIIHEEENHRIKIKPLWKLLLPEEEMAEV